MRHSGSSSSTHAGSGGARGPPPCPSLSAGGERPDGPGPPLPPSRTLTGGAPRPDPPPLLLSTPPPAPNEHPTHAYRPAAARGVDTIVLDSDSEVSGDPFAAADAPALRPYALTGLLEDEGSVASLNTGTVFIR